MDTISYPPKKNLKNRLGPCFSWTNRFYYMVGEPYHGGDFMTLTQRAKDQRVQMTEEMVLNGGGTVGPTPCFRKETPEKVELILFFNKKTGCKKKIFKDDVSSFLFHIFRSEFFCEHVMN